MHHNIRKTNMRKMKARKVQMASAPGSRYPADHLFGIFQHLKEPNIYRAVPLTSHQDPHSPAAAAAVLLPGLQQSGGHHHLPPAHITLSPGESWEH